MSGERQNPAIDYIYSRLSRQQAAVRALHGFEASLRESLETGEFPSEPLALRGDIFRHLTSGYKVFDREAPLVALTKAVSVETGIPAPSEIVVIDATKSDHPEAIVLEVAEKDTSDPPRLATIVKNGELYVSAHRLRRDNHDTIGERKFMRLMADIPNIPAVSFSNGRPILLYNAALAHEEADRWEAKQSRKGKLRQKRQGERLGSLDEALWVDAYLLSDIYDIPRSRVVVLLADSSATTYRKKQYFLRDEAAEILTKYVSEKRSEEGIYYRDGEARVTLNYLHHRYGFAHPTLRDRLSSLSPAYDKSSGQILYPLEGATEIIQKIEGVPQIDKETMRYQDQDEVEWATRATIARELGLSYDKLRQYTDGEESLPIRTTGNRSTVAYKADVIEAKAIVFSSLPREDDPDIVANYSFADELAEEWDLPRASIRTILSGTGIRIRGAGGRRTKYRTTTADDNLASFLAFPAVDEKNGTIVTASGEEFGQQMPLKRKLHIHPGLWDEVAAADIPVMMARRGTEPVVVYKTADVKAFVSQRRANRKKPDREYTRLPHNDPSAIEAEAARLVATGVVLKSGSMEKTNSTFKNRVERNYPGGFKALRIAIGLDKPPAPRPTRKVVHWEKMKEEEVIAELESQARALIAKGEQLNHTTLRARGYSGFSANVSARYPGGMDAMRRKMGIEVDEEKRSWADVEDPKVEIQGILYDIAVVQKSLTTDDLKALGLMEAVYRRYPGAFQQLLVDFGLKGSRRAADKMTPAAILTEALAMKDEHGHFSTVLAERIGKLDLVTAIRHHYPGGVSRLMKDMGERPNRTNWTPRLMEAEARRIYAEEGRLSNSLLAGVQGLRLAVYRHYPGGLEALKAKVIPPGAK